MVVRLPKRRTIIVAANASTAAYLEARQQEDSEKSVVVRIDRIGRRWLDTLQCIMALWAREVKIKFLDETEGWTRFLELEPDDPLAFVGPQMISMMA